MKEITETELTNNNPLAIILPQQEHIRTQNYRNLLHGEPLEPMDEALIKPFLETTSVLVTNTAESQNRRHNFNKDMQYNKDKNYILYLRLEPKEIEKTMECLRKQMEIIKNKYKWNAKSHFVIAILENSFARRNQNIIKRILQDMYSYSVINVIVLMSQNENKTTQNKDLGDEKYEMTIGVFTWFPYRNPKSCHHVQDVSLIDIWLTEDGGRFLHNASLFPHKIGNDLKGCPIRVTSLHYPPIIASIVRTPINGSGPDKITYEGGSGMTLFHAVAGAMNVSAVFIEPPQNFWGKLYQNGSWDGITGQIESNLADISVMPSPIDCIRTSAVDYTVPYHYGGYVWWVPCAKPFPKWMSITRVFSLQLWLVGLASAITAAFFMLVIGKYLQDASVYREISSCLAASWAVLLGVSVSEMPRSESLRVFFVTWVCYSLAINTIFQAYLTSYLIDPGLQHQISSMDEIIEYEIEYGTDKFLAAHLKSFNDPQINIITRRLKEVETRESAVKRIATHNDFALLDAESATEWYINTNYIDKNGKGMVCSAKERFVSFIIAWEVKKGSPLTGRMNRILRRLFESGLTGFWLKTERQLALIQTAFRSHITSDDEYCELSIEHLQGIFYLLVLGHLASFILLLLEKLWKNASWLADHCKPVRLLYS
jgi:hypothetical protein